MRAQVITRRDFGKWCAASGVVATSCILSSCLLAQTSVIPPIVPGPEVDEFKKAQQALLLKYGVAARSRYLKLDKPPLTAHVLDAGKGPPVLMLHGGNATAAQFAPLMSALQTEFHCFAPDRPGCGLTDKIDYRGVPFRAHAVDFVTGILDGLEIPKVAIVANSMGGYWSILFALAHPERVTRLVLLGEPAASGPPQPNAPPPAPAPEHPTIEGIRAMWKSRLGINVEGVSKETWDEELAGARLPGAALAWDSMRDEFQRQQLSTYALRPELKGLRPETLFIWGDKDSLGTGAKMGQEMAAIAPHARCEVLPDAGHMPWLDQTERCAQLTIEFLKSEG
jgi:pimeloyl-ACP methyl ester carboxylesterase